MKTSNLQKATSSVVFLCMAAARNRDLNNATLGSAESFKAESGFCTFLSMYTLAAQAAANPGKWLYAVLWWLLRRSVHCNQNQKSTPCQSGCLGRHLIPAATICRAFLVSFCRCAHPLDVFLA